LRRDAALACLFRETDSAATTVNLNSDGMPIVAEAGVMYLRG
jgi:hypothetical protein